MRTKTCTSDASRKDLRKLPIQVHPDPKKTGEARRKCEIRETLEGRRGNASWFTHVYSLPGGILEVSESDPSDYKQNEIL